MRDLALSVAGGSLLVAYAVLWQGATNMRVTLFLKLQGEVMRWGGFGLLGYATWGALR